MKSGSRGSPVLNDRHGSGSRRPGWGALCALLVFAVALGCGKFSVITQAPDKPPVTIKGSYFARGCIAVDVDPTTGIVSVIHKQDGDSNWAPWRVIPTMGAMVLVAMGKIPIIGGAIPVLGPSEIGGCVGIFAAEEDPL